MKCNVVKDLLPLYLDHMCNEETMAQLEEHCEHCEHCKGLKASLEREQEWPEENQDWERAIEPLKKVKKKLRRKNIILGGVVVCLALFMGLVGILIYGQLHQTGISFELIYDAARFHHIGKQFAAGDIESLYNELWEPYILRDEKAQILHQVYQEEADYHKEMKRAILKKYQQYFSDKHLEYKGIEEICYSERNYNEKTLCIYLKFEAEDHLQYSLYLQKEGDGKYRIRDYFGEAEIVYVSGEDSGGESSASEEKTISNADYHTEDSLFSCIANEDFDVLHAVERGKVRVAGERALAGDDKFAKHGTQCFMMMSKEDLLHSTYSYAEQISERLKSIMEMGYYPTDFISTVVDYDRDKHLFCYRVMLEFTNKDTGDKAFTMVRCYQVSRSLVVMEDSTEVYGDTLPVHIRKKLETLF